MGLARAVLERPTCSTAPVFADDEESSLHSQPDTQLFISSSSGPHSLGHGVLYITSKRLVWQHGSRESSSYAVEYRQVLMHAISRGSEDLPQPAIYCQLEQGDDDDEVEEEDADEAARGAEEEEVIQASEVRFVPDDAAAGQRAPLNSAQPSSLLSFRPSDSRLLCHLCCGVVDAMYAAMCQGAALNPDPVQGTARSYTTARSLTVSVCHH
jgi:hypothetical protein